MTDLPVDTTQDIVLRPVGKRQRARRRTVMLRWLAAGVGASFLSGLSTRSTEAATGDAVLAGQTVDATAPTRVRNGVSTTPDSTADGVQGYATGANNSGLFGRNNVTDGIGVSGAAPSGTGVFGESVNGFGVGGKSDSKYGVYGKSNTGEGVYAESTSSTAVRGVSASGVGGSFAGGLSAIRLVPASSGTGAPTTGAHLLGELYSDSAGTLFYCTTAGTPGTWQQVALGSGGGGSMTNPMTTQNDIIIGGTSGAPARLAKGANGQVLTMSGSSHVTWATPSGGGSGSGFMAPMTAPPTYSTWTWVNQGSATGGDEGDGVYIQTPGGSGDNLRALVRSTPSTPYTLTALLISAFYGKNYVSNGLVLRESSNGKIVALTVGFSSGYLVNINKYNSATSWNSAYISTNWLGQSALWIRLSDNGTTRTVSFSVDGWRWLPLHSVGRTDWITPDQVGFYVNANQQSMPYLEQAASIRSWSIS